MHSLQIFIAATESLNACFLVAEKSATMEDTDLSGLDLRMMSVVAVMV